MAQLARIIPATAVACPTCQERLADLPLDDIAAGVGYDCPHCGQPLRISAQVVARLIEQRDACEPSDFDESDPPNIFRRLFAGVAAAFRALLA